MKPIAWFRLVAATALALGALYAQQASAQVPGRFYWKGLTGANAAPLIFNSITGNTNPFNPAHTVVPDAKIDATMALMGYAHTFALGERSAMAAILLPMGRLSGDVTVAGRSVSQSTSGFGDPTIELAVNILGPKAQKNLVDALRYEPGFSVDLLADLALPLGEYDSSKTLNIGQNRWYGRLGAPIVWQIGDWVPGRRTTLEFLPAVWMFGNNTDYDSGKILKTDALFQLDAHLTRDFTENFWGGLDASWYNGGKSTVNGVEGKKLNNVGWGITFGYKLNENANLTFGYKSTVNDNAPDALRMDSFMVTFVYGWHPLLEGSRRLKSEK